jgi:hypothetical protein
VPLAKGDLIDADPSPRRWKLRTGGVRIMEGKNAIEAV